MFPGMAILPAYVWINGSIVPTDQARLSPFDHGFTVGDGVFETLLGRGGRPFTLRRHWQRLATACEALGIAVPSMEVMRQALLEVMQANGLQDARLRFTISSGEGPPSSEKGGCPPTMVAVATPVPAWPGSSPVVTVPWTRNERGALAGLKCTSYAENVRALMYARTRGAGEAILANTKGELCEGTGSNIFVVHEGGVLTPPLHSGCLPGITRALVIEACRAASVSIEERTLPLSILDSVEEVFITSSTRGVHPVSAINGRALNHVPGSLTREAAQAYAELAASGNDP